MPVPVSHGYLQRDVEVNLLGEEPVVFRELFERLHLVPEAQLQHKTPDGGLLLLIWDHLVHTRRVGG